MLDSAAALARVPLFSQLSRIDLAKLAGELVESRFPAGTVVIESGAPGDAFYVVAEGVAEVRAGATVALGVGEGFGEMALLADSPRTATVAARTDLVCWRLGRGRFLELLERERGIAAAVERALSRRLAATTREAAGLREAGLAHARRALAGLRPEAARLLGALSPLRLWPRAAAEQLAAAIGPGGPEALAELLAADGFLELRGNRIEVESLFSGSHADPGDLALAARALEASDDVVAAVRYRLAMRDSAGAALLLDAFEAELRLNAVPSDVEEFLATAGTGSPDLLARLQALSADVEAAHRATVIVQRASPADRATAWKRRAGLLLAPAVYATAWIVPLPAGLERPGLVTLGAILATVPLLVTSALPDFAVALALLLALVVPGVVPPSQALAGFASPSWIMMLTLFATGAAVARSGLLYRLALVSLERLPANFFAQSAVLSSIGLGLSAGVTSPSTRVALGVPIARGISDALSYGKRSGGSAAIGLLAFFVTCQLETLFLTGVFTNLVVHGLMPPAARAQVTWGFWFVAALAPHAFLFAAYYSAIVLRFRPHRSGGVDLRAIRLQRRLLGRPTREEVVSAAVLVALVAGFATRSLHGLEPAWIAVGVFLALFLGRVLDRTALQNGTILGVLVYLGVIMGLGGIFSSLGIDSWLGSAFLRSLPAAARNPFVFLGALAGAAFALHFFVPWSTASSLLALASMPLAQSLGIHPFVAVITALVAGDHTFLPYVNQAYAIVYFAADGELFSHEQARPMLFLEAGLRVAALLASVPVWKAMGLL